VRAQGVTYFEPLSVGEALTQPVKHATDLTRIREAVRRGALAELSRGPGRPKEDPERRCLREQLYRVKAALKEMSIKVTLLEGKERRAWWVRSPRPGCRVRPS
jgi:hypothetical protein